MEALYQLSYGPVIEILSHQAARWRASFGCLLVATSCLGRKDTFFRKNKVAPCYTLAVMRTKNHTTWIEISRMALSHNIATIRSLISPKTILCATVKANAYGHGAVLASQIFLEAGADWLAVHSIDEALEIRQAGINAPIYILGFVPKDRLGDIIQYSFDIVVYDLLRLRVLADLAKKNNSVARVHIKLETGLNRQGISIDEVVKLAKFTDTHPALKLVGITSHFANIEDTTSKEFANFQFKKFQECFEIFVQSGIKPSYYHIANSAATILYPEMHLNFVRPGIACYGIWPSITTRIKARLKNPQLTLLTAFTWKALVAQVKEIKPGESVGYGRTFTARRKTRLAIIPIGYYEGFDRRAGNVGHVLINGKIAPVVGRVSMNNIMVDCTECGQVRPEDEVVLLGRQGASEITAEEIASWTDKIPYEVPTRIGSTLASRIPRIVVN